MKLVEIVMLMGAHCVSPVEHGAMMTEAAKVQCAVMIEKDADRGTLVVTPPDAASVPQVAAAMARIGAATAGPQSSGSTKIVPASAPAGAPASEIKLPPPKAPPAEAPPAAITAPAAGTGAAAELPAPVPNGATSPPSATKAAPMLDSKVATLVPPPPKRPAVTAAGTPKRKVQPAAAQQPVQCKSGTLLRWTRTADGKRLYRCVKPGRDSALNQIY
ncbi:MAG: hypothetical protein IOC82_06050 [Aestuariivirga sp.]|uniref:hypothetical protein n=1 Tax=Aestuariivirga sp. TaxID=2650926 RepID=UPI0025C66649|nr:hypothetical protein [Aestuariivirga sp.]MCA3560577.1 hypothetical protein [Aestuariivirga sp.]